MRNLAYFLTGVLLAALSAVAFGADVTVSWTHPTQFTDGTPLALSQIAHTRVERGSCSSGVFATKQAELIVPAPTASAVFTGLSAGATHCYRAFTVTTAAAGGRESEASASLRYVTPSPAPKPPVIVTVEAVAYDLTPGGSLGKVVGAVALGTVCGQAVTQKQGRRYYELPLDQVDLDRMPRSPIVVGQCAPT